MPPALQAISYVFPLRHYYLTYADVAMFGATFTQYWSHLCWLLCFMMAGCIGGLLLNRWAKSNSDDAAIEC
jgi:ABC-type multidrug transport system permease subunit